MVCFRSWLVSLLLALSIPAAIGQRTAPPGATQAPEGPTIRVESNLVFLDVTVVDKQGRPVVDGLGKEDFTITEDKQPQRIFSFEPPELHAGGAKSAGDTPENNSHVTVFVLDLLNSDLQDAGMLRDELDRYLAAQPVQLAAPAELMAVGNNSLELLEGYTRSRDELLFALRHLRGSVPYKRMKSDFDIERVQQSVDALEQIALQNKGIPGRKNVVWLGYGAPTLNVANANYDQVAKIKSYLHLAANMLVEGRISLFLVYPGPRLEQRTDFHADAFHDADFERKDPFAGDLNFVDFVAETGGNLYFNRNDLDREIGESLELGSNYYTLTYQPREAPTDSSFRKIHVALRNPDLRAVTKIGYFDPDRNQTDDPRRKAGVELAHAVESTIPYAALQIKVLSIVRHPELGYVDFNLQVNSRNLDWRRREDGASVANFYLEAASLGPGKRLLASKWGKLTGVYHSQNPAELAAADCEFTIPVRLPNKAQSVRIAIETEDTGRLGTLELSRAELEAVPRAPGAAAAAQMGQAGHAP